MLFDHIIDIRRLIRKIVLCEMNMTFAVPRFVKGRDEHDKRDGVITAVGRSKLSGRLEVGFSNQLTRCPIDNSGAGRLMSIGQGQILYHYSASYELIRNQTDRPVPFISGLRYHASSGGVGSMSYCSISAAFLTTASHFFTMENFMVHHTSRNIQ